jgi:putative membrane protein
LLGVFLVGATIGLALFSQVLHWALERHYDLVMAALIGLMIGSTRVLWPWPNGLDDTGLGSPDEAVAVTALLAVVGFALVLVVNDVALRLEGRTTAHEIDVVQAC